MDSPQFSLARTHLNDRVRHLVKLWHERATAERDEFSRFVFCYFCFNAIISNLSGEETDRGALRWTYENPNAIQDAFAHLLSGDYFCRQIGYLQKLGPIPTHRLAPRPQAIEILDCRSVREVLDFIYQVRCNLFHGRKIPNNVEDLKLVRASGIILHKIIGRIAREF